MSAWPTMAEVDAAGFREVRNWMAHLRSPQTDAERAVLGRIAERYAHLSTEDVR